MSKLKNMKRYRQSESEAWEQRANGNVPNTPEKPSPKHKSRAPYQTWLVPGIIGLVFLGLIGFAVKVFLSDDTGHKKALYQITLIKPPPEEKVKPPEPEKLKETPKESIPTAAEIPQPQAQDQPPDNAPPAGADLGVAGEGGAGSDGFGLVGKGKNYKGRDITIGGGGTGGGGMGRLALLTKYGWYTNKIQDEIKKQFNKHMEKDGGVPKGKFQITLKILLDPQGTIKKYRIVTSSGNDKLDAAVKATLPGMKISQAPPDGMPSLITLRILSQG